MGAPMRHILVAALALLGACTAGRPANCVVTPADLVECEAK
jgi:hypothetical protein